ncbi:MAG: hypothetical protein AMJ43_10990 [Coxiella sp. DG_40]|nr:MAG: hypothetical protein AMJ43_10990 [Coxiella sp. DG_40]
MKKGDKFRAYQKKGKTKNGESNIVLYCKSAIKMFPGEPAKNAPFKVISVHSYNNSTDGLTYYNYEATDCKRNVRIFKFSMWRFEPLGS